MKTARGDAIPRNACVPSGISVAPISAAYSFGWEGSEEVPSGSSLIEIDRLDRDGGTLLRFTHSGLPSAAQCAAHDKGWAHYLGRLTMTAAGQDPGIDVPRDA